MSDKSSRLERGIGTYIGQYTHDKVVDDPRGADAFGIVNGRVSCQFRVYDDDARDQRDIDKYQ